MVQRGRRAWLIEELGHTHIGAVFGEEDTPRVKVDTTTNDIACSKWRAIFPTITLGRKDVTIITMVAPGFWFPTSRPKKGCFCARKPNAYCCPVSHNAIVSLLTGIKA